MSEKQIKVQIMLEIVKQRPQVRILNLETLEGSSKEDEVTCCGFDASGNPISDANSPKLFYKLSGGYVGSLNLNDVLKNGLHGDYRRVYTGQVDRNGEKLYNLVADRFESFAAVAVQLSRNGCSITAAEAEKKITDALKDGQTRIYFNKRSSWNGMAEGYGMFEDAWEVGPRLTTDDIRYDGVNLLLKKLGSDWRIVTKKSLLALQKSEYSKLMK